MKRNILLIFSLLISIFFSTFTAKAVSRTLNPSDDTYTYSDNTIRGMETMLKTYHSTAGSQYRRITFLKFDISSLSPFAQSAKLRLYCNGFPAGGNAIHEFDLYPVTLNSWAEDDVTFLNFVDKVGADVTSPLLASYVVPAGDALSAGYIEFSDPNLLEYISDSLAAGKRYISFRMREKNSVKNGTSGVIVEFHSKENESGFSPELVIDEKDVEILKASDIKANNITIAGFSESKYRNVVSLAWNETIIPTVTATTKYPDATVSVTQATSLTGTESQRTAKVNIQNGSDILTYSVIFQLLPPPTEPRLTQITIDGKVLEFFDMNTESYNVYLPYTTSGVPVIAVQTYDPNATFQISNATEIASDKTIASRTAQITGTSADGQQTKVYKVVFEKLPKLDIVLAIGQSNMSGRGSFSDVTAPIDSIFLLTPAGEMEIAANPMNKYSNIRKDLSLQKLGPSYTCALALKNQLKKPVGFVVNAQGGSSITVWYQPGKSNYDATILRAKEAQRFGRIRAVIWHQGESDGGIVDSYMSKLSTMILNLRTALNEPDLYLVAGELAYWRGGGNASTPFNTMIRTISSSITNSDWVSAEGLTPLIDVSDPHFDGASQKILGQRYADKLIQHVFNNATATQAVKKNDLPKVTSNNQELKIQNNNTPMQYRINDLTARLIATGNLQQNETKSIFLTKGIYIISYIQNNKNQIIKQIIN